MEHRRAVDALVAAGELGKAAAERVHLSFREAVDHRRTRTLCYVPAPLVGVRIDLVAQVDALRSAVKGLDPETVKRAESSLERDIAFFHALASGQEGPLLALWEAGEIEADAEDIEAARFLIELLHEEQQGVEP